ncbi:MAG: HD domain-containing protein [Chloroflexi bacterium]|nr:HD domain-containing protein [Chloroflexota bacterium]
MTDTPLWQHAASFAARAHRNQVRNDERIPYFSHPARVAMTVAVRFGCGDETALAAAFLHDVDQPSDQSIHYLNRRKVVRVVCAELARMTRRVDFIELNEHDVGAVRFQDPACLMGDLLVAAEAYRDIRRLRYYAADGGPVHDGCADGRGHELLDSPEKVGVLEEIRALQRVVGNAVFVLPHPGEHAGPTRAAACEAAGLRVEARSAPPDQRVYYGSVGRS